MGPQNVQIHQKLNIDYFRDNKTFPIGKVKRTRGKYSLSSEKNGVKNILKLIIFLSKRNTVFFKSKIVSL